MESSKSKPRILILTPENSAYSTTFIDAHLKLLNAEKRHLHGVFFPRFEGERNILAKRRGFSRLYSVVAGSLFGTTDRDRAEAALENYIRNHKIDCVLAEFGPVGAEVTDVCRRIKCPLIVHFHGFDAYVTSVLRKYEEPYRNMFAYASSVIAVSRHMQRCLIEMGAPPEKVVYNCYGPANSRSDRAMPKSMKFISVGRFVDKKAPYLTLLAFAEVSRSFPNASLSLIGDGPLEFTCKSLAKALGIESKVEFPGILSHKDVFGLYEGAFCYVQHSMTAGNGDSEGTPVSILEAAHAGLPVVATRHAGIVDVVVDGETGFLVDEGDVEGMAKRMVELADDERMAYEMGRRGQKFISENFNLERHIATIEKLIDNAIHEATHWKNS